MLLADIKEIYDDKARIVSRLVIYAKRWRQWRVRPWPEWRASRGSSPKPITPNQLARLLKPFLIMPDNVRIGNRVHKGYMRHRFEDGMGSLCRASGGLRTATGLRACAAGTSTPFQSATPEPDVAVQKCEKSMTPSDCSGVAVQKGDNAPSRMNGDDHPGLSWRVIEQITRDIEEWISGSQR